MAWNEPGNRGESPWGKKRPAGKSGGSGNPLKDWQERLQALLSGGGGGEGSSGGNDGSPAPGNFGLIIAGVLVLLWLMSGWFQINASEKGVVQRFGRFTEVRNEGWG